MQSQTERKLGPGTLSSKKLSLPGIQRSGFKTKNQSPNNTMHNLASPMKQARLAVKKDENRKQKVDTTLKNFFSQNKLYLKSNNERAVIGPKHIQN